MDIFGALERDVAALRDVLDGCADELSQRVRSLPDEQVLHVVRATAAIVRNAQRIETIAAAVVAERSTRDAGQEGLAQRQGHRNATDLLQSVTGHSRANAHRQIRVGSAVLEGVGRTEATNDPATGPVSARPWHAPLGDAVVAGRISVSQSDAIRSGMGDPPAVTLDDVFAALASIATRVIESATYRSERRQSRRDPELPHRETLAEHADIITMSEAEELALTVTRDAWSGAAAELAAEARVRTVEELRAQARIMRDVLDPAGAERRFRERFEARSFRRWKSADGLQHGSIVFDDEGAAEFAAIFDAALRPRRGGPRFVDSEEAARAKDLVDDPRTNDQLAYDLLLDLVGSGMKADAATVLGTRQAGVRIISVPGAASYVEDGLDSVPSSLVTRRICNTGAVDVDVDGAGEPLRVGRTRRLFTSAQRVALGVRDGGCRWPGCDRPASYCEAHHIDPYSQGGRTDVDRGILLCRFHHMQLHNGGWRITRQNDSDFVLHPPGGEPVTLSTRLALRRCFDNLRVPQRRFRSGATADQAGPDG